MKKIFSVLSLGVLLATGVSCVKESAAVFDPAAVTPPTIQSFTLTETELTASFTPAVFNQSFNTKIPVTHTFVLNAVGTKVMNTVVASTEDNNTLTVTASALSRVLTRLGYADGETVSVKLAIRATMKGVVDNGSGQGSVESRQTIDIDNFEIVLPKGSPYMEYTETSDWSVIGALSQYEIDWNNDLCMWSTPDGKRHVAAHVSLAADDEFKFRKGQDWAVNVGGDFAGLENAFSVTQDGPNIKVGKAGVYDLFYDENAQTVTIMEAFDPYPEFTESSDWSVIGTLSKHGIDWNGDLEMISDGSIHVALSVSLAASDEFKFRQNKDWAVNLGGDFSALDEEFSVSQDGPNIKVGAEGVYDLFVNPGALTAQVSPAAGAKVSTIISSGDDGPDEPVAVTGWNIIGLNGDWDNDIPATRNGNVWTAYITAEGDTEFKWRKDGGWDENYGGVMTALGEPFEAVAGGDNIKIGAGFYKVELDTENLTITVSDGGVWSLIGDFNGWAGDVDMTENDGVWTSPVTKISGGFKIRYNHAWDANVGGTLLALGEPFEAVPDGDNISVEEGSYIVTYDTKAGTITVDEAGWGLVGSFNGWGTSPDIILKEEGLFLVARNVSFQSGDEFKLRYNSSWDNNRGGLSIYGGPVKAVANGDNFVMPIDGTFDVYYRPDCEVIIINSAGSPILYWGVVGTPNGWSAPDLILYFDEHLNLVSDEFELSATDEIKLRMNEDWAENVGGTFVELGQPFSSVQDGPNIKVGRDAKVRIVYNPGQSQIMLEGEYTGEAPSLPENMYIIGEQFGGWAWTSDGVVDMIPVYGQAGQFWAIRNIEAGKGFKFCSVRDWNGDFYSLGDGDSGFTVADCNCFVA